MTKRGIVYTFYSFKGGVGRSMALANVAALLAKWGSKVLAIDWDLEAPGLEKYFLNKPSRLSGSRSETAGVVDLITAYVNGDPLDWRKCILQAYPFDKTNSVSIITAGQSTESYVQRLQAIDWQVLFGEKKFGAYLEQIREEWLNEFDYVLIDSRTGITDIGGICTIHLPDVLVLLFTPNEQSLQGVIEVMGRAQERYKTLPFDRVKLLGVPVPSRFENTTEYALAARWKEIFAKDLRHIYQDWLPDNTVPADITEKLFLPYIPYWSFGEGLPVVHEGTTDPRTLGFAYGLLAKLLDNRLQWKQTIGDLVGVSEEHTPVMINQQAENIYRQLSPEDQLLARKIFTRLVNLSYPDVGEDTRRRIPLNEIEEARRPILATLVDAGLLKVTNGNSADRTIVEIAKEELIRSWRSLEDWLVEDRAFLVWRQQLRSRMIEWEDNEPDSSALLNGIALVKAERYFQTRQEDLNETEVDFIRESLKQKDRERRRRRVLISTVIVIIGLLMALVLGAIRYSQQQVARIEAMRLQQAAYESELRKAQLLQLQSLLDDLRRRSDDLEMRNEELQKLLLKERVTR